MCHSLFSCNSTCSEEQCVIVYFPVILLAVKNKFSHAYPQEYPYRINSVLECEFFLLEMMVKVFANIHSLCYRKSRDYKVEINSIYFMLQSLVEMISVSSFAS